MISVVIPFHNENKNLPLVLEPLIDVLSHFDSPFEVVLVDDGSTEFNPDQIEQFLNLNTVRLIRLGRRMGKGKALATGVHQARGDIIAFMDADFQDDPEDLRILYKKLQSGFDLVNGFRVERSDTIVIRLYSTLASWVLRTYFNSPFSDINCGFKIFRKKLLKDITLYGNNFRFFPLAAFYEGFRVAEVAVHNRERKHGVSKFGTAKLFTGILDMVSAYFLYRFADRPLHFFGPFGGISFLTGALLLAYITYERIFLGVLLYRRPALQYSIFLIILGVQIIMTGILGELIVFMHRNQHAHKDE